MHIRCGHVVLHIAVCSISLLWGKGWIILCKKVIWDVQLDEVAQFWITSYALVFGSAIYWQCALKCNVTTGLTVMCNVVSYENYHSNKNKILIFIFFLLTNSRRWNFFSFKVLFQGASLQINAGYRTFCLVDLRFWLGHAWSGCLEVAWS